MTSFGQVLVQKKKNRECCQETIRQVSSAMRPQLAQWWRSRRSKMKCGSGLTAAVYFEYQKQKFSDLLLTELPAVCVRITCTQSSPIAKELSGSAPIAAFVASIHMRRALSR